MLNIFVPVLHRCSGSTVVSLQNAFYDYSAYFEGGDEASFICWRQTAV